MVSREQLEVLFSYYLIIYLTYPSSYLSILPFLPLSHFFSLYSAQDYGMSDTNFLLVPLAHPISHPFSY